MESNKDEAQRCINIARNAIVNDDLQKALRFAKKSHKLYPSKAATDLEEEVNQKLSQCGDSSSNVRKRTKGSNASPDFSNLHGSSTQSSDNHTPAQKQLADRINKFKDYYDILGVAKDATEQDIKKAYRKMALQLHPDKNKAPGATEAFKAVGKAFSVLSDSDSREKYDQYGVDGLNPDINIRRRREADPFDNEFDAQELFNMFFGGGFPQRNMRVFRNGNTYYYERASEPRRRHHDVNDQGNASALFQLIPLMLIILLSVLGSFTSSDPSYTLMKRDPYIHSRYTSKLEVKYYVKHDFDKDYRPRSKALRRLEEMVESEYLNKLQNSCYHETVEKEQMRRNGMYFGNQKQVSRAEKHPTPSCDLLKELYAKYGRTY